MNGICIISAPNIFFHRFNVILRSHSRTISFHTFVREAIRSATIIIGRNGGKKSSFILFEARFLDPHFLRDFLSRSEGRRRRGIAGKTTTRTGVTGLWFVLTVYLHRARRSGLLARRARARACDFACREANHYETRFSNHFSRTITIEFYHRATSFLICVSFINR